MVVTIRRLKRAVFIVAVLIWFMAGAVQADTNTTTQNGLFGAGTTWVGGVAPESTNDSVVIDHTLDMFSEFTIGTGESMTTTVTTSSMRIGDGGHLTVATGGSMNLPGFDMPESGAGGHLTIEAGATARVDRYWNDEAAPSYINEWIADANGVTTFQIDGRFSLRGTSSILDVDLSNYDITNGTTLVLVDYGSLVLQSQAEGDNGWGTVSLTAGWLADLDLTYDQGGGDLAIALTNLSQHTVVTWDDGAGDDNWSSATNWVDDVAPTNGDSVVLTATTQSFLDYDWTIESGRSLTSTTNGSADDMGISPGASLTLATGGTMDIGLLRPRSGGTRSFIIEAGASLDMDVYGSGFQMDITFEADAMGVTTWNHSGGIGFLADTLTVDLSAYDIASGSELILVDYDGAFDGNAFSATNFSHGWTADLDYAYDQGGGDLAIALTNIVELPKGMVFTIR